MPTVQACLECHGDLWVVWQWDGAGYRLTALNERGVRLEHCPHCKTPAGLAIAGARLAGGQEENPLQEASAGGQGGR